MNFYQWRSRSVWFLALHTTLFSIISANVGKAATYYVGKSGKDNNSCSQAQSQPTPKLTITAGLSCLEAGDTLYVQAGTYEEEFRSPPGGISWEKAVSIAAFSDDVVTIRPPVGADRIFTFSSAKSQYVTIYGFILDAKNIKYEAIKITHSSSGGQSNYIRIENSEIKNAPRSGVTVRGKGHELINLDIHHNGENEFDHGIYLAGSETVIEDCDVHENSGVGIHVYYKDGGVDNNLILNNDVWGNATNGTRKSSGIILASGSGNKVLNNNVWDNGTGIRIDYGAYNSEISSNTVHHNSGYCIHIGGRAEETTLDGNICYENWYGILNVSLSTLLLN